MISALVLAAGESKRMGQPKMLLPWGSGTVIQQVVSVLQDAGIEDILVVTGAERDALDTQLAQIGEVHTVFNTKYAENDMLGSVQCGLAAMRPGTRAALICLGDQPQVRAGSVRVILEAFAASGAPLIVPSYQMRRGHPWLVARALWPELLKLEAPVTARDFLQAHSREIEYVEVNSHTILEDLDTPEDYSKLKPGEANPPQNS